MPILTQKAFAADLALVKRDTASVAATIQNLLVTACYYAMKDGNTTPLNDILSVVQDSRTLSTERLTKWVTLHAGCALLKNERFRVNESFRKANPVANEEDFAKHEAHLRSVSWTDIKPKDTAKNPWELDAYLAQVIKTLEKHADVQGTSEAMKEIMAVKGALSRVAAPVQA